MTERDDNRVTVISGLQSDGVTISSTKIDDATGRLLVKLTKVSSVSPTADITDRDSNRVSTIKGADTNGDPQDIFIDNRNNGLWATVTIE